MILLRQVLDKNYVVKLYIKDGLYYVEGHNHNRQFKTVPMRSPKFANDVYIDWVDRCKGNGVYGRRDCPVVGPLKRV